MLPSFLTILALLGAPDWTFETSQAFVNSIYDPGDGTVWFSTAGGILHWDPLAGWDDAVTYPEGLPWFRTNDLAFDGSDMWVATDGGGLALERDGQWSIFTEYEGIPGSGYIHAVHTAGGYVWVGTNGGLARGNATGFIPVTESETGGVFKADEVTGFFSLGETLHLATDRGIYSYDLTAAITDPAAWESYETETANLGLEGVYSTTADSVFGYGPGGLAQFVDGHGWQVILDYSTHTDSVVNGVAVTELGLVAAAGEVLLYQDSTWTPLDDGYPSLTYSSCLGVVSGVLWCGFGVSSCSCRDTGRGPGYYENGSWVQVPVPGMAAPSCYQIAMRDDRFYLGSHRMGLMAHYPGEGWLAFNKYTCNMPNVLRTYSAAVSSAPGVWTGSYSYGLTWIGDRGTYTMSDDSVITFVADSLTGVPGSVVQIVAPLLNNQVVMLTPQGSGLWVAQEAFWQTPDEPSGIVGLSGDPESGSVQWAPRSVSEGLAHKNVQTVFAHGEDSLWVAFASSDGCQLLVHGGDPSDASSDTWHPGAGEAYTTSWGLPSGQVFCFAVDGNGSVIAGTGNGICRWQGDAFVQIPGVSGSIRAISVDEAGRIWCISSDAMYRVDGSDVEVYTSSNSPFIPTSRVENEFSYFDESSGRSYFSSIIGLWSVALGSAGPVGATPMFYPQPYLPAEGVMGMSWSGGDGSVEVGFFAVDGSFIGSVSADSPSDWSWDGTLDGGQAASGVYMVLIRSGDETVSSRIAVVR